MAIRLKRRRLIDALMIKGRLTNEDGDNLPGQIRVWIPGRGSAGKVINVHPSNRSRYKISIVPYTPFKRIRVLATSPGYLPLDMMIHPKAQVFRKGIFSFGSFDGAHKTIDYGDQVMIPEVPPTPDLVWWTENQYGSFPDAPT